MNTPDNYSPDWDEEFYWQEVERKRQRVLNGWCPSDCECCGHYDERLEAYWASL